MLEFSTRSKRIQNIFSYWACVVIEKLGLTWEAHYLNNDSLVKYKIYK